MIRNLQNEAKENCQGTIPDDNWMVTNCPTVLEYLVIGQYDDKTFRTTSTITIFVDAGVLKLCLNERDACCSLYVTGPTLQDAFLSLEKAVSVRNPEWRPWKRKPKR